MGVWVYGCMGVWVYGCRKIEMQIKIEMEMEINKKSCLPGIGFEPMTSGL